MRRGKYNVETPERVIEAAARLFSEQGYRALTAKDVSRAARVAGPAVNYHFGDKAGLYHAVIRHCLDKREAAAPLDEKGWRTLPPQQRLKNFIAALVEQLLNERAASPLSKIMLWEAIDPTDRFDLLVERLPGRQLKFLDAVVREWVGPGLERRKVRAASIGILGQCVYYRYGRAILETIERRKRTSAAEIRRIAEEIYEFSAAALDGLSRGTKRPPPAKAAAKRKPARR